MLDKNYYPIINFYNEILAEKAGEVNLMVEDGEGYNYAITAPISKDFERSFKLIERLVKSFLWCVGGCKIFVTDKKLSEAIKLEYNKSGKREFDCNFMETVYKKPLEIIFVEALPKENRKSIKAGGYLKGCRIGFDAGGSDRKVSAVVDGEVVYSEEVVWLPKINTDISYHYDGVLSALETASSKMKTVDAVGVSSAGIYNNNMTCVASLFQKVDQSQKTRMENIYIDCVKELSRKLGKEISLAVANDGDVTALAGCISFGKNNLLGIAMGTSEAGGYVNDEGGLNGFMTELAFVPCDIGKDLPLCEWSGDYGTGVNYFSQDAVIRLAKIAGIELDSNLSPAEKLKVVQGLMSKDDPRAEAIYKQIGVYLGNTLPFYSLFYNIEYCLVLGRVFSGKGGEIIVQTAQEIVGDSIKIVIPDEKFKRVGQSIAAASLPRD